MRVQKVVRVIYRWQERIAGVRIGAKFRITKIVKFTDQVDIVLGRNCLYSVKVVRVKFGEWSAFAAKVSIGVQLAGLCVHRWRHTNVGLVPLFIFMNATRC